MVRKRAAKFASSLRGQLKAVFPPNVVSLDPKNAGFRPDLTSSSGGYVIVIVAPLNGPTVAPLAAVKVKVTSRKLLAPMVAEF